jgi:MFS family permease
MLVRLNDLDLHHFTFRVQLTEWSRMQARIRPPGEPVVGFLVTGGTIGDRIGRRRLLLIGAAAVGATSVVAAYATSSGMLIAVRVLLAISGATASHQKIQIGESSGFAVMPAMSRRSFVPHSLQNA